MILKSMWYGYLQYLVPKFMRKWWCNHNGLLKSGPEVDEVLDMSVTTKIECAYCGKSARISLWELWTVGIKNLKLR